MVKVRDIVLNKLDDPFIRMYGRISRFFPDGRVETLDCGKYIRVCDPADLEVCNDYKGYWTNTMYLDLGKRSHFIPMPSLRKLKRMCARYDRTVWKKYRGDELYCKQNRFMVEVETG